MHSLSPCSKIWRKSLTILWNKKCGSRLVLRRKCNGNKKKNELVVSYLAKAKQYLSSGSFDKAIETAERITALSPTAKEKTQSQQIIVEAQEKNRQIAILLLEAKKNIEDNKIKEADALLKRVIKMSPENEDALKILTQISSK